MLGFLSGLTDMLSSWGAARSCPSYCNCPHQLSVSQPLVHLINTLLSPPPPAFPHLYASQRDSLYSNSTCLNIHEFLRKAACSVRLQEKNPTHLCRILIIFSKAPTTMMGHGKPPVESGVTAGCHADTSRPFLLIGFPGID